VAAVRRPDAQARPPTATEQKTAQVWDEYRKKQEALEAQFLEKAPK
jgi:hypothetical protein